MTKHLSTILATAALTISLANAVPTLAASVRSTDNRLAALEQLSFDMCGHINALNFARIYVDGHQAIGTADGPSFNDQISTCRSVLDS